MGNEGYILHFDDAGAPAVALVIFFRAGGVGDCKKMGNEGHIPVLITQTPPR